MKKTQKDKIKNIGIRVFATVMAAVMILGAVAGALISIFA